MAQKLLSVVQFVNEFPKWPLLLKNALTIAIVKYLVVRNYRNLLVIILDIWTNSQRRPYADARVTYDLLGPNPCPLCPNYSGQLLYIATIEFRV